MACTVIPVQAMRRSPTHRTFLVGISLIGLLFLVQNAFDHFITSSAEARSWRTDLDSIASIDQLYRVAHDLDEERILVGEHITASNAAAMARIDVHLMQVWEDLHRSTLYARFVGAPMEAPLWNGARALVELFQRAVHDAIALSRQNLDEQARAMLQQAGEQSASLDVAITALVDLNRDSALASVAQQERSEKFADHVTEGTSVAALLVLAALGGWLVRRLTTYEDKVTFSLEQLAARNRELDAFAGRVAHDLNNALGPIVLVPSLLRRAATNPSSVLDLATRTERSGQRAKRVVDSLLAFARAAQDVQPDEVASVREVVAEVLDEVAPIAAERGATIETQIAAELSVRCDPGLLHVVLANLVGNAVKYLEDDKPKRVAIAVRADGNACRIDVTDTGAGIPRAARDRIFEPFFRASGTRKPGTGIGLATVRRVVTARGGRIAVDSEQGRGSRFSVWLPAVATPSAA